MRRVTLTIKVLVSLVGFRERAAGAKREPAILARCIIHELNC